MNVHGEMQFVANDFLVLPSKLVSTINALGVPVCPIQAVFKDRDGKGMREAWGKSRKTSVQTWSCMALGPGLATAQISPSAKAPRGRDRGKHER